MYSKIVIKFPWISNFDLKLGGWDLMFKIPMSAFVFLIFILKVRYFKHKGDHRPFLRNVMSIW